MPRKRKSGEMSPPEVKESPIFPEKEDPIQWWKRFVQTAVTLQRLGHLNLFFSKSKVTFNFDDDALTVRFPWEEDVWESGVTDLTVVEFCVAELVKEEEEQKRQKELRESARKKLTPEEWEAIRRF